jgi:small ligand-binding sensory domain FIST
VLRTLRFRPALEMAQSVLNELPPDEQALLENGLYVGVVTDEYKAEFGRGDFLVRNLVGADEATGALVIADEVRPGQTIQFHLRDGASADEDLRVLLSQRLHDENSTPPAGALLFSCNGRGTRLFDAPDHDVRAVENAAPGLPVAGFFAAGEIGPVGPRSFLHGHTASIALFYPG